MRHDLAIHASRHLQSVFCWMAALATLALPLARATAKDVATAGGAIVPIRGTIDDMTLESLKRRVGEARQAGAKVIVFEMDTPGGLVSSALDICNYIKALGDLKTVAWVHPEAYSAGAMIAVACNEIVVSPVSHIGDCAPILIGADGLQDVQATERAKMESPIVSQFRDSASRNGYDTLLSESMVRLGYTIWWVENTTSGERRFVNDDDKKSLLGDAAATTAWRLVTEYDDPVTGQKRTARQPVVSDRELLTMNQSEAVAFGFAKAVVDDTAALASRYDLVPGLPKLDYTWSELLVGWLTGPIVRSLLLTLVLIGVYAELKAPGLSIAGAVALVSLALFLGAPYLTGLANVWEIVVLLLGVGLLALELFVIPGFGIAGIAGLLLIVIALIATFVPEEPGRFFPLQWPELSGSIEALKVGLLSVAGALTGSLLGMVLVSRFLPRIPVLRGVIPENPAPSAVLPADPYHGAARVGDYGRCEGPLRPAGKARFGALLVDVVTQGSFCEDGVEVEVVERRGNRIVVRPVNT